MAEEQQKGKCQHCGYETELVKVDWASHTRICPICKEFIGMFRTNRPTHDISKMIAWGINYLADLIKEKS